jgi:hypothetical protein
MNTFDKGYIGEMKVAAWAAERGYLLSKPLAEARYDFVLDDGSRLWRAQVKYVDAVRADTGAVPIDFRSECRNSGYRRDIPPARGGVLDRSRCVRGPVDPQPAGATAAQRAVEEHPLPPRFPAFSPIYRTDMTKTELDTYWNAGLSYAAFRAEWEQRLTLTPADKDERKMQHYRRYNLERTDAVESAYTPGPAVAEVTAQVDRPQWWIVLTEDWCGDSSFLLPVVARIAQESAQIELRILPRDQHLELMDQYLTNGGRSIPKLIAFDAETGDELFTWGPRPDAGAAKFLELKASGLEKPQAIAALVDWYAEGGWKHAEPELVSLIGGNR